MMITIKKGNQELDIDAGELIGYRMDGYEYIHQKGSPGWRSSDTEMFPIIGPTAEADFRVRTPKGEAVLDQHGLFRELDYELLERTEDSAVFLKSYEAGTQVKNSKYPEKSTEAYLSWPYDFRVRKEFVLDDESLRIHFHIDGEDEMPYMFGYHPAFRLEGPGTSIDTGQSIISLDEVLQAGSRALEVPSCESVILRDKKSLAIDTKGFGHFMLWTEVPNMICIEPITFYPYAVKQEDLHKGFDYLEKPARFEMRITPHG